MIYSPMSPPSLQLLTQSKIHTNTHTHTISVFMLKADLIMGSRLKYIPPPLVYSPPFSWIMMLWLLFEWGGHWLVGYYTFWVRSQNKRIEKNALRKKTSSFVVTYKKNVKKKIIFFILVFLWPLFVDIYLYFYRWI